MREYVANPVINANGVSFNPYDDNGCPTKDGYLSRALLDAEEFKHAHISGNIGTGGYFKVISKE